MVKNNNLRKHMLATEACLRRLAQRLGGDPEAWGLAGLVHDVDYEQTKDDTDRHGLVGAAVLEEQGFGDDIIHAVRSHGGNEPVESDLDRALYAADPLTGLIVAAALMHPDKRLAALDVEFVMRRYKTKGFARGANREQIETCSGLGLPLEEFIGICLDAMRGVSADIGL